MSAREFHFLDGHQWAKSDLCSDFAFDIAGGSQRLPKQSARRSFVTFRYMNTYNYRHIRYFIHTIDA